MRKSKDACFEIALGGIKQGFALSYGDLFTVSSKTSMERLVDFTYATGTTNSFRMRSAGSGFEYAGGVNASTYSGGGRVDYSAPVRVALALQID